MLEPALLTVTGLTVAFAGHPPAVDDLSFTLGAGERLGLVGLSGSGKSLTAAALLGLLPPGARVTAGTAVYRPADGPPVDLLQLPERALRRLRGREISLVFQEPQTALNPVHRVGRQLTAAARSLRPDLRTPAQTEAAVRAWLDRVELGDAADRIRAAYPHQLSGGQRQRVLIALALLGRPRLLLADEPTTALDTITEAGVLRLLDRLGAEERLSSVFVTHDLPLLAGRTDRIIVMAAGRAVRRGDSAALLARGDRLFTAPDDNPSATATPPDGGADAGAGQGPKALVVRGLTVSYGSGGRAGSPPAVRDVSLSVARGEWVAVVGPSGCGKTTLARATVGLLPTPAGAVRCPAGRPQLIFQDPYASLNPALSLRRALTENLRAVRPAAPPAALRAAADGLLDQVGLPAAVYATRLPADLSGGQRQRVAIARALASAPGLLIADEAVSALDAPLRTAILDLLDELRRGGGPGLLFISHDLDLVLDRADRVVVMDAGRIVEVATPEALRSGPVSAVARRLLAARR